MQRVKDDLELSEMILGCVTKTKDNMRAAAPIFSSSTTSVLATAVCICVGMINFECQNTHSTIKVKIIFVT